MELTIIRALSKGALVVTGLIAAMIAAAQDTQQADDTDGTKAGAQFVEELATGLYLLPLNHTSIVSVVQGSPQRVRVPITVEFVDTQEDRLLRKRGVVGPRRPFVTQLRREDVFSGDRALVQARVRFGPAEPTGGGLLPPSCPVTFAVQTVSGPEDTGDRQTCVADPCSATQGIGGGSGRFPAFSCTRNSGSFAVQP